MEGPPSRSRWRRVAWVAAGAGADHITALPLELRARIAAALPFRQVARLSILSRPWRHIHHHTPVVDLTLGEWGSAAGVLDEAALAGLEAALTRRGLEGSGSKVDTLRISYSIDDARARYHAGAIVALSGAREVCITVPIDRRAPLRAWSVELPPAVRELRVTAHFHLAPTVAGPGAAALRTLCLDGVVLREWPCLPSLCSLTLFSGTVEAPFPPGAWCPRLENLRILYSPITLARVDIRLPLLKRLEMKLYDRQHQGGDITVDAPELEELDVVCTAWRAWGYRSFTLRAPRLRCLNWSELSAGRVFIDVGRPGSVTSGRIRFKSSRGFEINHFRAQMARMLEGLLPELVPDCVADAARPYMSLENPKSRCARRSILQARLTCDLTGLMSSLKV